MDKFYETFFVVIYNLDTQGPMLQNFFVRDLRIFVLS